MAQRRVHDIGKVCGEAAATAHRICPERCPCFELRAYIRAVQQIKCSRSGVGPRYRQACP